jgi:hypothetical protein
VSHPLKHHHKAPPSTTTKEERRKNKRKNNTQPAQQRKNNGRTKEIKQKTPQHVVVVRYIEPLYIVANAAGAFLFFKMI